VCVDNSGQENAAAFVVAINGTDRASIDALAAGDEACVDIVYGSIFSPDPHSVTVDYFDDVEESDEGNNGQVLPTPNRTRCDAICPSAARDAVRTPTPPPIVLP